MDNIIFEAIFHNKIAVPEVTSLKEFDQRKRPLSKQLKLNPNNDELVESFFDQDKIVTASHEIDRNIVSGHVHQEPSGEFDFEGHAQESSVSETCDGQMIDSEFDDKNCGLPTFRNRTSTPLKRKLKINFVFTDVNDFEGPCAKYRNEQTIMRVRPIEEMLGQEEIASSKNKQENIIIKSREALEKCCIPKKLIHTWKGHSEGVSVIKWFPKSGDLLLSCSMDRQIKIWDVYGDRKCIGTYIGHKQAVRDVNFNNDGSEFCSASYDHYVKLWDTETGKCVSELTNGNIPNCVKFNPNPDKQNLIVAGTFDNKIICWDIRSGEIIQDYNRHLEAVNSITFIDGDRRFVSTSDDRSIRVWEWGIPVDFKCIDDTSMCSMPSASLSPNKKWIALQSMENKIAIFSAFDHFKITKKIFRGHMVAGYACGIDFSPDMSFLVSGDADGKAYIWNGKTTQLLEKWKAHDNVCSDILWHPYETSKVATASWDGLIKYWG